MKKKHITLEEVLKYRDTNTNIYCDTDEFYYRFEGAVLCRYNFKNEIIAIGTCMAKSDKFYVIEKGDKNER